jgi:hypothetical protein
MPLAHVLWRLRENRDGPCRVKIVARCPWPGCVTYTEFIMPLTDRHDMPQAARCVVCRRELCIISAGVVAT